MSLSSGNTVILNQRVMDTPASSSYSKSLPSLFANVFFIMYEHHILRIYNIYDGPPREVFLRFIFLLCLVGDGILSKTKVLTFATRVDISSETDSGYHRSTKRC